MKEKKAFNNWSANSLHLTFPNGNSLSTIWHYGSYSDNYDKGDFNTFMSSDTVEIMILKAPERLIKKINKKFDTSENVIGRLTITQWLWVVNQLAK